MKMIKILLMLLCITFSLFATCTHADIYNYSDFTITGDLPGTEGANFIWASSDNKWEQGAGYVWGVGNKAIIKYSYENAADITLTMVMENGEYDLTAMEVFANGATTNPEFYITVEGVSMNVIATIPTGVNDYSMGTVTVEDGQLDIVIGTVDGNGGGSRWYGLSGFEVAAVPEPATMCLLVMGSGLAILRRKK